MTSTSVAPVLKNHYTRIIEEQLVVFDKQKKPLFQLLNEETKKVAKKDQRLYDADYYNLKAQKLRLAAQTDVLKQQITKLKQIIDQTTDPVDLAALETQLQIKNEWVKRNHNELSKMVLNGHERRKVYFLYKGGIGFRNIARYMNKSQKYIVTWFHKTHDGGCDA